MCVATATLYVVLLSCLSSQAFTLEITQLNVPQELPDGLLVTNGSTVAAHVATWTVLVVLDAPQFDYGLSEKLQQINVTIAKLNRVRPLSNATRTVWFQRMEDLTLLMTTPSSGARVRRGLLNVVGEISNKLFGTATEAEVNECRVQIARVSALNKRVVHTTNELITIVNQSRDEIKTNRQHVRHIEHYLDKLANELWRFGKTVAGNVGRIIKVEDNARIDRLLAGLESVHTVWLRQMDLYQRQRASLELGWMTEEVLAVPELRRILVGSRRAGWEAPRLEWYYENVHVQAMWEEVGRLVFRAELPLIDDRKWLRYRIRTWPVPQKNATHQLQLEVPGDVVVDTGTGHIFLPQECAGHDPAVCRTGPIYDQEHLQCPRGVVSGLWEQRRDCKVTIIKVQDNADVVQEVTPGMAVISTWGSLHPILPVSS